MIAEYTGTTLNKSYTWGMDLSGSMQGAGGVGGLLAVNDGTASYYPTYDGNGNVSEYLDSAGATVAHYEYDAFGNTIVSTGSKVADFAHRFSTKPHDDETGLYYYGYRYYDPVTGRWPSRDPIEEDGGYNLYAFVGNDGVNQLDYLGKNLFDDPDPGAPTWVADAVYSDFIEVNFICKCLCYLEKVTFSISPECENFFKGYQIHGDRDRAHGAGSATNPFGRVFAEAEAHKAAYEEFKSNIPHCYEETEQAVQSWAVAWFRHAQA